MQCPQSDSRSGRVVFVSHCLLNANAKVCGLAKYPAMLSELVRLLDERGVGIIQLPCPEFRHLGPKRWWQARSQYDVPAYRALCRKLAAAAAEESAAYSEAGYAVLGVLGVDGSPSCGVSEVYDSPDWWGEPAEIDLSGCRVSGTGVFVQALQSAFAEHAVEVPFMGISSRSGTVADTVAAILGDAAR